MSLWRGRALAYDPDRQAIELERQQWVYERVAGVNECITELTVLDPDREYSRLRLEYEHDGDLRKLHLALEYLR